jgi:hypothetical protein
MIKRYEYRDNKSYNIKYYPDEKNKFMFISGDYSDFCRMMSNVINESTYARDKEGEIEIAYKRVLEEVEIRVKDNGQGMPQERAEKMMSGEELETTKKNGHGIGMQQIRGTLKEMKGKMEIKTQEGVGTEFIFSFPRSESPRWFADKIELKKGDTVVIVDDEESVNKKWKEIFKKYKEEITVTYFTRGLEAIEYISSLKDKRKALLLTKYELKDQEVNGVEVVEKSNMKDRHILVTGLHLSKIKEFNEKSGFLKILFNKSLLDVLIVFVS